MSKDLFIACSIKINFVMEKAVPSVSPKIYGKKVFTKQIKSKAIKETKIIFLIICFVVSDIFIFTTSVFKFNFIFKKIIAKKWLYPN